MAIISSRDIASPQIERELNKKSVVREAIHRRPIINTILLVITVFQLTTLPGALINHNMIAIEINLLGLILCALGFLFNYLNRMTFVGILLIAVIDLGCGLMLLTSPMGLDTADLLLSQFLIC